MTNTYTYKPFKAEALGTTVSCYTLERMLNEIESNYLTKKVVSHIGKYFAEVKRVSLGIDCVETRKYVGELLLKHVKHFDADITCPSHIANVVKNIKYAYIKDMFIATAPINYCRKAPDEFDEASFLEEYGEASSDDVDKLIRPYEFTL